jgi:excisionase family DNA binding protein
MTMLTVPEVALALRISRSKVYELIRDQNLQTVKIGRLRRIDPRALYAFVASLQDVA